MSSEPIVLSVRQLRSGWSGPYDLELQAGTCMCVTGPSGSGKSALLRLIADLDPNEGEVELSGTDRRSVSGPAWRQRVVYQAAEPVWWRPTFREHLQAGHGGRACIDGAVRLGLAESHFDQPLSQLSTGQRQRLALVRSLAARPQVLLLDEPTASLDPQSALQAESLLKDELAQGLAIIWVTHSEEQAARMADRMLHVLPKKAIA